MNTKEDIRKLLEKYQEGQTSLKEEKQLRYYFLFEDVDEEFRVQKLMFQFFESEKQVEFTQLPELNKPKQTHGKIIVLKYWKVAVAAILIIGLGITWINTNESEEIQNFTHEEVLIAQKYLNLSLETLDRNYIRSSELLNNAVKIEENAKEVQRMGVIYESNIQQFQHINYIDQSFKKLENIKSIQKSKIKLVM